VAVWLDRVEGDDDYDDDEISQLGEVKNVYNGILEFEDAFGFGIFWMVFVDFKINVWNGIDLGSFTLCILFINFWVV
jgi:hypothetical protein